MRHKVLYFDVATPEVYEIIRGELPPDFDLITLTTGDQHERLAKLPDAEFILVATAELTEEHMTTAGRLRLIQHQGVGYDRTDAAAARKLGIPIGLTPEGTTIGVAEHTILLMLSVYKHVVVAHQSLVRGEWLQFALRPRSYELWGKTAGLVGFGRIGQEVARRLRAFGVRTLFYDKYESVSPGLCEELHARQTDFETVLSEADIVSLHVPVTPETSGIMKRETFAQMKPHAILINTSRGKLVREEDLIEALESGVISGAGLDVFEEEPLPVSSPLLRLQNVVLTPHISAGTRDALVTKMRAAFANMVRATNGEQPLNLVQ